MITSGVLKRAIEEAEKSTYKQRIGAVIFRGSCIISSGHNGIRSSRIHPKHKQFTNSLHAEQDAMLKVKDWSSLKGASIFVIKLSKSIGKLGIACPCEMCQELIEHVGIKHVWFSNEHGEIVKL